MTNLTAEQKPEADSLPGGEQLLRDANRRTDDFLAMLGHEMRNPLSALSNALHVWPYAEGDLAQMEELRDVITATGAAIDTT